MTQEFKRDLPELLGRYTALSKKIDQALSDNNLSGLDRDFEDLAILAMLISSQMISVRGARPT